MYDAFLRNSTLRLQEDIRNNMSVYVNEKKKLQGQLQGLRRDVNELRPRGSGRKRSGRVHRRGTVRGRILLPRLEGRDEAEEKLRKLKENELALYKDKPIERGAKKPLPLEKKPEDPHKEFTEEKVVKGGEACAREAELGPVSARTKTSDIPSFTKSDKLPSARDSKAVPRAYKRGDRRPRTDGDRKDEAELTDGEEDVYRPVMPFMLHDRVHGDDNDSIFRTRSTRSHRSKKMVRLPALPPSRLSQWSSGLNIAEQRSTDSDSQAYLTDSVDFSQISIHIPKVQDPHRTEIFLPKGARGSHRTRKVTFGHRASVSRLRLNGKSDPEMDNEGDGEQSLQRSRNLTTIQEDDKGAKGVMTLPRVRNPRATSFKDLNSYRRGGWWSRNSSLNKSTGFESDHAEFSEALTMDSHDTSVWKSVYSSLTDPEKRTHALADILYAVRIRMMENEQTLHYGMLPESLDGSSVYTPRKISKKRPAMSVANSLASSTSSPDRRACRSNSQQLQAYLRKMHKQRRLADSLSRDEYAALRDILKHQPPQTPSVNVKA